MTEKKCSRCGVTKGAGEFHVRRRRGRVELQAYCKACCSENAKAYREKHGDRLNRGTREWFADNRPRRAAYRRRRKAEGLDRTVRSRVPILPCFLEGAECDGRMERHHFDYAERDQVAHLCQHHHRYIHNVMRRHGVNCDG